MNIANTNLFEIVDMRCSECRPILTVLLGVDLAQVEVARVLLGFVAVQQQLYHFLSGRLGRDEETLVE